MSLTLDELKTRLRAVEDAISARISGSGGVGGATTELRNGERQQRWAQFSYEELTKERDRLAELIRQAENAAEGKPLRRALRVRW